MTTSEADGAGGADRALALATYGMLIAAPLTFGSLGFLAIAIAYIRRGRAEPLARGHFERQADKGPYVKRSTMRGVSRRA